MDDLGSIVSGLTAGGIGITGGGAIIWALVRSWLQNLTAKVTALEGEVRQLRNKHVATIETRLGKIEERCVADQAKIRLDAVSCTLARMEDKLSSIGEDASASRATIDSFRGWIRDVREEVRAHVSDGNLHGGDRRHG